MKIHFVCSGNTFRSRLAEAYLNSKNICSLHVSTSGIEANKNLNGPIAWYAARIIKNNNLIDFMSGSWKQTTKETIKGNDVVIFMKKEHYEFCKNFLFHHQKYEVWNIEDVDNSNNCTLDTEIKNIKKSEEIFNRIKNKVDSLIQSFHLADEY